MVDRGLSSRAPGPSAGTRLAVGLGIGALAGLLAIDLGLPSLLSLWRGYTWMVIGSALGGALLFLTRLRRLVIATAVLLGALWLAVVLTPLSSAMTRPLLRADPLPPEGGNGADVIFVFSSSLQPDGEPGMAAMTRLL